MFQLTDRVARLEAELAANCTVFQKHHRHDSTASDVTISNGICSATQTELDFNDEGPGTGLDGVTILPPPPPPPPMVENFKFTSTPNPVFLSRGKLHQKAKGSSAQAVENEDKDSFMKRKKQRYLNSPVLLSYLNAYLVSNSILPSSGLERSAPRLLDQLARYFVTGISMPVPNGSTEVASLVFISSSSF